MRKPISRRAFVRSTVGAVAATSLACNHLSPLPIGQAGIPILTAGVMSGDITANSAIVWAAVDRPARMVVEWSTQPSLENATRIVGPDAGPRTGLTARVDLQQLPADTKIHYRIRFENLDDFKLSEPATGSFQTAPSSAAAPARDLLIAWSGDTAGQGWGIDPKRGGMRAYAAMLKCQPDLFIHSGDTIYADIPIPPAIPLQNGGPWENLLTPAKSKVAQTLNDFRGNYAYNLLDSNLRAFNASVPMIAQWDDHEVRNNWYPGQVLDDPRYQEREVNTLAMRARQAFLEYTPTRRATEDPGRIYRNYALGPLLEIFVLDQRSYRGRNSPNKQTTLDRDAAFLGPAQLAWLKQALASSQSTWKLIASDMPLSCICRDGAHDFEAWANGDHTAPLGRELELAQLLSFIRKQNIQNVLFITADVHYPATIHYHPDRATFKDFLPFHEFISGPIHAGVYGPNALDQTFGPEYLFQKPPKKPGMGPGDGLAYFGLIRVDHRSQSLTVSHRDIDANEIAITRINPM